MALTAYISTPLAFADNRGWEYEPYHIHAILAIDAPGGVAEQLADELPRYLQERVRAAIGPLWSFEIQLAKGEMRHRVLDDIAAASPESPADYNADGDKLLLLAVELAPSGYELRAREFDRYVERWSAPNHADCRQTAAIPERLFALACQTVAPLVQLELDPNDERRVLLVPRGAALLRNGAGELAPRPGDVFLPFVRRKTRSGELAKDGIQSIPWTIVEVAESSDGKTSARVHSGTRRPLGAHRQGRIEQVAIALRTMPADTVLQLHSRTAPDKPLVGYQVFAQEPGEEQLLPLGLTDRDGSLAIPPGAARVRTLYIKNGSQLLARLPIVPGAQPHLDVPLPDDEPRLAAEAQLAALREELIDVVARRNIIMSRARQKIKQRKFDDAKKLLADADLLPSRSQFDLTLSTAARTLRSKDPQIQRRIDRLVEATQTVMNQYLDLRPINQLHDELRAAQQKGS